MVGAASACDRARCRREVLCRGARLPETLCSSLLSALRATRWPVQTDRPKVEAVGYLVLEKPIIGAASAVSVGADSADAASAGAESASMRRARRKREQHGALWEAVAAWMELVDPAFDFSGVALSKDFRGSPHVDTYDISYQWALSLGNFEGGQLCMESAPGEVSVIDTHNRAAKVDGRFPHWVAPWAGERYSVIAYKTRGDPSPLGPAVHPLPEGIAFK
mmetsp:Transcript_33751/g.67276  ORF Transcript_33751/g.67276 Transcript_33751/m.67276 type:complete len:220 (-) Transcript_33751:178-837(-)